MVWCLTVPDDFLLVETRGRGEASGGLLVDVELGDVAVAAEDGEPALLALGTDDFLDKAVGLLPEGELAGEDGDAEESYDAVAELLERKLDAYLKRPR